VTDDDEAIIGSVPRGQPASWKPKREREIIRWMRKPSTSCASWLRAVQR
jgi:hypothetical protein